MADDIIGAVAAALEFNESGAPSRRVKLLPVGPIAMRDGRGPFLIRDLAHAEEIVAATRAWLGGADFNFDYDHQTAFAVRPEVGGTGLAAGWAKAANLTAEADGIYANDIEWTAAALGKLSAREYRYVSPLFRVSSSGEVERLRNAALVNVGGIDLPAIAAAETVQMGGVREGGEWRPLTLDELKARARGDAFEIRCALTPTEQLVCQNTSIDFAVFLKEKIRQMEQAALLQAEEEEANAPIAAAERGQAIHGGLTADELEVCASLLIDPADFLREKGMAARGGASVAAGLLTDDERSVCASLLMDPADYLKEKEVVARGGASIAASQLTADEIAACEALGISHETFLQEKNRLADIAAC